MSSFLSKYDAAFINAFNDEYRNADVGNKPVVLDEGRYQFAVSDVKIVDSNNFTVQGLDEDAYYEHALVIELRVLSDGAFKGKTTSKWHGICLKSIRGIKGDLEAMGHEFHGLEGLVEAIANGDMLGLIVEGRVTKKQGKKNPEKIYTNIWLDRTVGKLPAAQEGSERGFQQVDDDELPW